LTSATTRAIIALRMAPRTASQNLPPASPALVEELFDVGESLFEDGSLEGQFLGGRPEFSHLRLEQADFECIPFPELLEQVSLVQNLSFGGLNLFAVGTGGQGQAP